MLKGSPASDGIGIGHAVLVDQEEIVAIKREILNKEAEKQRFSEAMDTFCASTLAHAEKVKVKIGEEEANILVAHTVLAQDPELLKEINATIERESVCAEYAFAAACDQYITLFSSLEDELIRARAADFRDIKHRLLCILLDITPVNLEKVAAGSILIAEDISPSQATMLNPHKVAGIVTKIGTKFSHIAIIARAMQIPAVVAVDDLLSIVKDNDTLILDGHAGDVYINPTPVELRHYEKLQKKEQLLKDELQAFKDKATLTADGQRILLAANLAVTNELELITENKADGIGLYRTEFLYMNASVLPTEEQQFASYKEVAQALGSEPVIIRTLDIGGDKDIPYMGLQKEENPFLGYRAIRFCLNRHDIFKAQLSALLRASAFGNIKIMIPMISGIAEVRASKEILAEVKKDLDAQGISYDKDIQLGIMVETPAAALCAEFLAKEVDFFSIGTNDLTQYTLAVDRGNENVASLYTPFHPAVLRMIKSTVDGAKKSGILVGICGEAGSDPLMVPLLIGLGVEELSVSSSAILPTRKLLSTLSKKHWEDFAREALSLQTPGEVIDFVKSKLEL